MNLIINCDDLGASKSINDDTFELFENGIITSSTIIANSNFFNDAIVKLKNYQHLGVGVHLCVDGPFNISTDLGSIIDRDSNEFYSLNDITHKIRRLEIIESELFKEYSLQIEKVMDNGIKISHLDHHHHLHIYYPILKVMINIARKYKIKYIRPCKVLLRPEQKFLNEIYRSFLNLYLRTSLNTVDGIFEPGINNSSNFDYYFIKLSKLLTSNKKTVEIILHPGNDDNCEINFFRNERVQRILKQHKHINYHDLYF